MNTKELDIVINQIKQSTESVDRKIVAPALVCCAVELLADLLPCKHQECFKPGIELLVNLMVSQALVTMERRGFDDEKTCIH